MSDWKGPSYLVLLKQSDLVVYSNDVLYTASVTMHTVRGDLVQLPMNNKSVIYNQVCGMLS